MLDKLFNQLKGDLSYGIEVTDFDDKNIKYVLTALKTEKKELNLDSFYTQDSFDLPKQKKIQAGLVINTNQVLIKTIQKKQTTAKQTAEVAFPNIDIKNFYFQSHSYQNKHFIALIRKTQVDNLVVQFEKKGIYISDIILGHSIISCLNKISDIETIFTSNAKVIISSGDLSIKKVENLNRENYNLQGIDVDNTQILSFLSAVDNALNIFKSESNFDILLDNNRKEFKNYLVFFYGFRAGIILLLLALMVNFYFFNNYYDYVNQNQGLKSANQSLKATQDSLKTKVEQLDKLTAQILQNQSSLSSYYINDVIRVLPENINLSEVAFQPLEKRIRPNKPIELMQNYLVIKGQAQQDENFILWNNALENLKWVDQLTITKFDALENKNQNKFELKLIFTK